VSSQLAESSASIAWHLDTEAEDVAASEAARKTVWLKRLLDDSDTVGLDEIPEIHTDNQATIILAQNPEYHRGTKHIQTRHFFVKEKIAEGETAVKNVRTELQVADTQTKPVH